MARINDLQAGFQKTLAYPYGRHVVQGYLIQHIEEFVGNEGDKQITLLMALGEGAPDEDGEGAWDGVEAVYYRGRLIDEANWHFHGGKLSNGEADPDQGIDSFFPGGITYSGTAYIAIRLPVGVADEADPSGLDIIVRTAKIADYDADGNVTEISYSANPARVKANMIKRRGQLARVNWASFIHARDWYDFLLDWEAGSGTPGYSPFDGTPDLDIAGPISAFGDGGCSKAEGAADAWDNYAATKQVVRATNEDGSFTCVVGQNTKQMGMNVELTPQTPNAGPHEFGVAFGFEVFWICYDGVCYAPLPYEGGDSFKIAIEDGQWKLYQNDGEVTLNGPAPQAPAEGPLYGVMRIWEHGGIFVSSALEGFRVSSITPSAGQVPRFEAHPAFTGPVDINKAIDYVDFLTASDTQDAGKQINFLTPEARSSCHTFTEGVNCRSVRIYEKPLNERPNRLWATFRNLDLEHLEEDEVSDNRDDLYDKLGYTVDPGAMNFASMNGSQAQRLIKFYMRRRSGRQETVGGAKRTKRMYYAELIGFQDSYRVLQADVVTGLFEEFGLEAKDWLVLRATRESPEDTFLERKFVLQEYARDDYRDTDHGSQQPTLGTQPTSPFEPPGNPFLTLEEIAGETLKVRGTILFPAYAGSLIAKVYITPPGGSEFFFDTVTPVSGTSSGTFDYIVDDFGEYTFRVVVETSTGVPGGEISEPIEITDAVLLKDFASGLILVDSGTGLSLVDSAA